MKPTVGKAKVSIFLGCSSVPFKGEDPIGLTDTCLPKQEEEHALYYRGTCFQIGRQGLYGSDKRLYFYLFRMVGRWFFKTG